MTTTTAGTTGGDDIPSGSGPGRDCDDLQVNGVRDLVDWFPVFLDLKPLLNELDPEDYSYTLKQEDHAVNFLPTDLTPDHAGDYLTDVATARQVAAGPKAETGALYTVSEASPSGEELDVTFLLNIRDHGKGVILVEGKTRTTKPLILSVAKRTDLGHEMIALKLPLSISPVEEMFRHKNLRAITGGSGGASDRLSDPINLPDKEANGQNFVFVHGYNVDGEQARGAHSEIFKRMFWSGSRARFYGVSWRGDQTQGALLGKTDVTPDYEVNINNAFASASLLAQFLSSLDPAPTVCAHSLGNMLVGSAIHD